MGLAGAWIAMWRSEAPRPVGGQLAPCPSSPNCVSSQAPAGDAVHHVAPLLLHGDPDTVAARLEALLAAFPGALEVEREGDALRMACRTRSWLFIDDVDLVIDRTAAVVHVRSASRIGYGDLGANRLRVRQLREAWSAP